MARDYALNPNAAKAANTGGKRITEHGRYVGKFRAAWYEKNHNGTESVSFIFVSDAGQEAGPLTLYTHNSAGKELPSHNTLHAILTCMRVKGVKAQPGVVKLWDRDAQAEVDRTKDVYPALCDRPIGLVLTEEEYESNGEVRTKIVIGAPFAADSGQMADEVLGSKPAGGLDKYLAWLDKSGRWIKRIKPGSAPRVPTHTGPAHASDFDDDSIPF